MATDSNRLGDTTATETATRLVHRNINNTNSTVSNGEVTNRVEKHAEDLMQWKRHAERIKSKVLDQIQGQLSDLLDKALTESVQTFTQNGNHGNNYVTRDGTVTTTNNNDHSHRTHTEKDGKVFMDRRSILDDLFEINHIRTIYHMFISVLFLFIISTLAVDYIDQGRLVLEFDLLSYAFGKLHIVALAWLLMFSYTLAVPYYALALWGTLYHRSPVQGVLSVGAGLVLSVLQAVVLGILPVYVVFHYQLPPASRFIIILEQIRFLMKSYSFIRENVPVILKHKTKEGEGPRGEGPRGEGPRGEGPRGEGPRGEGPRGEGPRGEGPRFPTFSSYLYFLFAPTLIYRESYPRNPHIRWNYVGVTFAKILGCLFYGYFILVRLCIPVFMNDSNTPFSTRTLVLALFHATLPGMLLLLLAFFAFLHCWLNAFAEMLCFADRMFYKDWWNSTSFANYYRTWNVVVHDWLYYYGYRDFLWLSRRKFRTAAMLSVFAVSALVHEYVFTLGFGFFYPVMFCLFAFFGVAFNFTLNDKRKSPVWNIMMWTCLFIGQGVMVCLYCQEWYAQIHCPRTGDSFWELVTPRSWSCSN
ncbi:sterol O-acyltransferase 2 isoform X1 [Salvelinus namaycush]|uniref:O-acyltransferase n=1 Tax=Salvelinus namaycush TaxID=8040 RepID=A0A8U1ETU4_SALNM|nr:sterol O-acyltransferase 2 isoform X1 [Salvelinus namaycush]